jgi:hypothetical protein
VERELDTDGKGGWVGPRAGMDVLKKRPIFRKRVTFNLFIISANYSIQCIKIYQLLISKMG